MPIVTVDGQQYNVADTRPETIQAAVDLRKKYRASPPSDSSFIGDIGRGIAAGAVSIPQGIVTIPTTGIDLLFNTDITDDVNELFESIKPEVEGTAGQTAQLITQFGVPGLGVAKLGSAAFSKLTKPQQLAQIAAVDAAVATDDVDTVVDMIFDKESDEERLKTLQGRDAALARLTERLQVFGETAAVMYAAPVAVSGAVKGVGAGLDLVAPYMSALAKATVGDGSQGVKQAAKADNMVSKFLGKYFRYGGKYEDTVANNKLIADVIQAKMLYTSRLVNPINDAYAGIRKTIEQASSTGGKLNDEDALQLTKAIATYRAPILAVERQFPGLTGKEASAKAKTLQDEAMKKIKSFEGSGNKIDYEELGIVTRDVETNKLIGESKKISEVLDKNKGLFAQEQQLIFDMSKEGGNITRLFIEEPLRDAIGNNIGLYGTTTYRALQNSGFRIDPKFKDDAIQELMDKVPGLQNRSVAENAFEELTTLGSAKQSYETPKMFVEGINFGLLKGKDLKNLPAVRKAMGEITALDYKKPGEWRKALTDEAVAASETMSKLGALAGKAESQARIFQLNKNAIDTGRTTFLKTAEELAPGLTEKELAQLPTPFKGYIRFGKESGSLNGLYAPESLYNALNETGRDWLQNVPTILKKSYQGFLGLKALAQYGKTILGPTAQIRNNTSVPIFALMNGNLGPSGNFSKNFKASYAGLFDPRQKTKYAETLAEGIEQDVIRGKAVELEEFADLSTFASNDIKLLSDVKSSSVGEVISKIKGVPERAYTGADNAARLINYDGEKFKLGKVFAKESDDAMIPIRSGINISDPQMQQFIKTSKDRGSIGRPVVNLGELKAAGDDVVKKFLQRESSDLSLNLTPTYSRVPEIVRALKYAPVIGNFTAFPAEILRNTANTLERAIIELTSNSVELQKVGMRRLTGALTTTVGLPAGLTATALTLTGAEQEQIDAYRRSFAAPWERTATLIPTGTDGDGNITGFYNFSYTNPYEFLQRPIQAVVNAYEDGVRDENSLLKIATDGSFGAINEIAEPFVSPSIGAGAIAEAYQGRTATGRIIYNESDSLGDKVSKGLLHTFNAVAPTALPFTIRTDAEGVQFVKGDFATALASLGSPDKSVITPTGKDLDVAEAITSAFSGIKVTKPQIDRSLYYKAAEAKRAIRETTNEYNRLLRSANERDADTFIQGYINSNNDRFNSLRTLYTAIEDARTLGLKDYEIDKQLKDAKVANRAMVMAGLFKPIQISTDLLNVALTETESKAAQPIPLGELFSTQAEITGQGLQGQFIKPRVQSTSPSATRASDVLRQEELNKILTGSS